MLSKDEKEARKREAKSRPGYHEKFEEVEEGLRAEEQNDRAIEIVGLRK